MYNALSQQNQKLTGLQSQMNEMDQDFDEMMRMRNEAKKRLEEKFKDVYQKIRENKQHTINEGKKVNDSLKRFQDKFNKEMIELTDALNTRLKEEEEYQKEQIRIGHERMENLEQMVKQEREDRIESLESQLVPIRQDLKDIQGGIEVERNARVQKEKEILEVLAEESVKIEEAIEKEKTERLERQAELYQRVTDEIDRENQWIERFQRDAMSEFQKDKADIEKEMDNRFNQQDEVVQDISHFISTFQKTLKAVGKDSQ